MAGTKQRRAVLAPNLHIQIKAVGAQQLFGVGLQGLPAPQGIALQGAGDLLQVVVKQGVGLLQRAPVSCGGLQQRGQHNGHQHKAEQLGFERVGYAGHCWRRRAGGWFERHGSLILWG